jgi:hypothetical protein
LAESVRYRGLNGAEILIVRDIYKGWWDNYKDNNRMDKNPLEDTSYRWF